MRDVAVAYYVDHLTMETIARNLGQSRSSVSRLLRDAREAGVVSIQVSEVDPADPVAGELGDYFGVTVHPVAVPEPSDDSARLDRVARTAATLLHGWIDPGCTLGVAWGTTVGAITQHLPQADLPGVTVVQLNGAVSPRSSSPGFGAEQTVDVARRLGARAVPFPVPAFFDFAKTKEMMWQERSVRHVLDVQASTKVAVFGIGAVSSAVPSRVYASDYLDQIDRRELAVADVVGDVCTVFLRADGTWEDIAINARATGPDPRALSRIERRVAVVASRDKAAATLAALRAHTMTDLVIDAATARAVLAAARV